MSVTPRSVVILLSGVALIAVYSPMGAAAPQGGSPHGGAVHASGGFGHMPSGGFRHTSHISHVGVRPTSSGHAWHTSTPHVASRFTAPNHIQARSVVNHGANWSSIDNGHRSDWNHHNAFWVHHGRDWDDWWRFGIGGPFFSYGWWPGYYGYWYPQWYAGSAYGYYGYDLAPYGVYRPEVTETVLPPEPIQQAAETNDFYSQAIAAFQQGDYRNATRLAGHAAVDEPKNPDVHMLLSLGLFAVGQYRGAAAEAHAVVALGKIPDWPSVIAIYGNDVAAYTKQLRTLEKSVRDNPTAPESQFLLGFHYLIDGHKDAAQDPFLQALKLTPRDDMAARLLTKTGGVIPADIAKQRDAQSSSSRYESASGVDARATK
jgi:hypothetical protein